MTTLQKIYSLIPDNITQRIIPQSLRNGFKIIDEKIDAVSSGFIGAINRETPEPEGGWLPGIYIAEATGVYTNQDDLDIDLNDGMNLITFDGNDWTKIIIPNGIVPTEVLDYISNKPVNSKAILDFLENRTQSLGELNEYAGSGFGTQSIIYDYTPDEPVSINQLEAYFNGAGTVLFHVANDLRDDPGSDNMLFTKVSTHLVNISGSGYQKIDFSTIVLNPGDYIVVDKVSTAQPYFGTGSEVSAYQVSEGPPGTFYGLQVTGLDLSIKFNSIITKYVVNIPKNVTKINVVRNVDNYNSIRNTINAIVNNNENNRYEVYVANGVWPEYDILAKPFVKLILSRNAVILTDPEGTMADKIAPVDCSFPSEAGKRLDAINQIYRHVMNPSNDFEIEGGTISAIKCKYAIHLDNSNYKNFKARKVHIISENCKNPVGIGAFARQNISFEQCTFERVGSSGESDTGFFIHNWNAQTDKAVVNINKSKFVNCAYLILSELGSNQSDEVHLTDCFTTYSNGYVSVIVEKDGDGKTYWTNPNTSIKEPNPVNVPYFISLTSTGTKIDNIYAPPGTAFNPAWSSIPMRDLATFKSISIIPE
ncbi:hypothetical protein [Epilithonimonas sp. UC225_85]|uniref:hypothetical protein n=1 Tax=Epilithonimonas sp. UC225_85 TaxID=3350167 RepID=UPI0036D36F4D